MRKKVILNPRGSWPEKVTGGPGWYRYASAGRISCRLPIGLPTLHNKRIKKRSRCVKKIHYSKIQLAVCKRNLEGDLSLSWTAASAEDQVWMYYRSGTGGCCHVIALRIRGGLYGVDAPYKLTFYLLAYVLTTFSLTRSHHNTFLREMTSWPPSWKCDVKSVKSENMTSSVKSYSLWEQSRQISPWSDLKRRSLMFVLMRVTPTRRRTITTRCDLTSLFQDGGHDVISCRKVPPPGE